MLPKVGIFGTSPLASAVIHELQSLSFEVVGLWNQNLKTAKTWSQYFNIPFPTDSIEVLLQNQEVDLAFICSPPHFHKEIATKALAAGKHVICEPPLGITIGENAAIMEQALYYPSLMVLPTFGMRYLSGIRLLRSLLKEGFIGNLQSVSVELHCGAEDLLENLPYSWTCIRQLCAGPLFTTVTHIVDVISFLSEKKAYTVCSTVKRFQENPPHFKYDQHLTREDFVSWQMLLESNIPCICTVNNNFSGGKFDLQLTMTGSKGALTIADGVIWGQKYEDIERRKMGELVKTDRPPLLQLGTKFDYRHPEMILTGVVEMCTYLKRAFEPLTERRCFFADHVVDAGSFSDAQYARAVSEAIRRSSETRKWVEVKIPLKKPDGSGDNLSVSLTRFMQSQR